MNIDDYIPENQMTWLDQGTWFGKMFQEHSVPTKEKTSAVSSKKQQKLQTKMPLFLDLRGNGHLVDALWGGNIQLLGDCMMPNIGEYLNGENAYVWYVTSTETPHLRYCLNLSEKPTRENPTKLSDILQEDADEKYNLSPRACNGILNRAERRGKALPEILKEALQRQGGR